MNEIAKKLDVAKSRCTKLVRVLLDKGYLERTEDPRDIRVKWISPTEATRKKIEEVEAIRMDIHKKLVKSINPADRTRLIEHLESLIKYLNEVRYTIY